MSNYEDTMKVINRRGETEEISFDEIKKRIKVLVDYVKPGISSEPLTNVSATKVTLDTISKLYDGITTRQLDTESAKVCASLETVHHNYGLLGGRIMSSDHHKQLRSLGLNTFTQRQNYLNEKLDNFFDPNYIEFINLNAEILDSFVDIERDYLITYFGFKTLERSYLIKYRENPIETPQDMFMRVSIAMHFRTSSALDLIKETYDLTSMGLFTHATPTLFNAGTRYEQMSSCYLLGTEDSLEGIFKTISDTAQISKWAGGIGIHISNVRSHGSRIKSTNGKSDGIIPMLKVYNETARYANQCFTPETWVYSVNGPKHMRDITTNDYLVTIDGTFKKVNEVIVSNVDKQILEITTTNSLFPIRVTEEHDIYLIKDQPKSIYNELIIERLEKDMIKPDFYQAGRITEDDIVGFPIPTFENDIEIYDEQFCKFYGLMLSDAYQMNNNRCILKFNYNLDNRLIDFVTGYLNKHGINFMENYESEEYITISWIVNNSMFIEDKYIRDELLHLPKNKIAKIFEGLAYNKELNLQFSSDKFIMQIRYLLLRLGVLIIGNTVNIPKDHMLSSIINTDNNLSYFEWNNILWGRIESIKKIDYIGKVYDFNMIDNHNYLTDMGLVHNSGKRKGSVAIYLEPWHGDIEAFLDLKKNTGAETERARDLFTAMWIPDEFMRRVIADDDWYLMCPNECPGLPDVYDTNESLDFTNLYKSYIDAGKYTKKIKAQKIFQKIMESQVETGVPYILFKDNINRKSNQSNIGIIKSSNLCSEITEVSSSSEYAVCNLGSIAVNRFIKKEELMKYESLRELWEPYHIINESKYDIKLVLLNILKSIYDFDKLREVSSVLTHNLNNIIDYNFYPVEETRRSNLKNRPIGIGVQGLGDLYYIMNIPYSSYVAKYMDALIMETINFGAISESNKIAKERGAYQTFNGSPFSNGKFQFDLWDDEGKFDHNIYPQLYREEWNLLKESVKQYGTSNSLMTSLMPTATTSQILGNNECFEPYSSNIYKRTTLAGEFQVVNKHLVDKLASMNMWNEQVRNSLITLDGSIKNINFISDVNNAEFEYMKEVYKTVWEVKQKDIIDHALARGPYIDQSQSMNLFFANPDFKSLYSAIVYGWKNGIKTGCYYLRSKPAVEAIKYSVEIKGTNDCVMCSA